MPKPRRLNITLQEFLYVFTSLSGVHPDPRYKNGKDWNELYLNTNNDTFPIRFRHDHILYTELFVEICREEEKNHVPEDKSVLNRIIDLAVVDSSFKLIDSTPFSIDITVDGTGSGSTAIVREIKPIQTRCDFVLNIYLVPEQE